MKLAELQQQFANALHYQALGEDCQIISDIFDADERMQIYRNNFVISLSEVLQATYPMVEALLGEECFAQVARQHVLNQPLTCGDVTHYGQGFDLSLQSFNAVMEAAPYIAEVAKFEWACDVSQQCFSVDRNQHRQGADYSLEELAQLPAEQHGFVQFRLHADVVLFASQYAVYALQQTIIQQPQNLADLDIQQPQQGICACDSNGSVWCLALEDSLYQLLIKLHQGEMLADIDPQLLTSLNQAIELELIAGFSLSQSDAN